MIEILTLSPLFGILLSFTMYLMGDKLYKKWPIVIFTPLLFGFVSIIILLMTLDIPYENFNEGGKFLTMMITPATVALAIRLEKNIVYFKKYYPAILTGICFGVLIHSVLIFSLALLFQLDQPMFATLLPKSITTAIAVGISESLGGVASLTVALVVLTGIIGALIGPKLFNLFHIDDPVAQGIGMGAGAHAMGTAKAIEIGEVEGAMSSLAIVITGIVTVIIAPLAMNFLAQFII